MSDPAPIINPYRVVFFLATILSVLLELESIPAEIKTWLIIALLVINAILLVFFNVPSGASVNPSIAQRIINKVKKQAA